MTENILRSITFRDKLYKQYLSKPLHSTEKLIHKSNLRVFNKILKKDIREAKKSYYYNEFNKYKRDIKKTCDTIKSLLNKPKQASVAPNKLKVNSQTISNEKEIASKFNNYFTDIGKNLADKIDTSNKHKFDHYLHSPSISKFHLKQTNPKEIISVINNLPMKTSAGHDKISCIILKEIKDIIAQPLSLLVNQAFNTGVFPSKLKLAKVIPLFKKGDKTSIENYRPISLLPCMSKVLEKIINIQLYDYFQSNNLLYKSQYGFRIHHSTEFASLELVDTIQQQLDLKLDPFAVFLDMSKAFDTLDHEILMQKFSFYGVQNTSLNLFKSYLSERSQFVSIGGTSSPLRTINTRVPQGSILGPLLFIIYINELHMASDKFNYILYADDTTLIGNISNFKSINMQCSITDNINIELDKICDWLAVNKLSLNASKSNYMIFHHRQKNLNPLQYQF